MLTRRTLLRLLGALPFMGALFRSKTAKHPVECAPELDVTGPYMAGIDFSGDCGAVMVFGQAIDGSCILVEGLTRERMDAEWWVRELRRLRVKYHGLTFNGNAEDAVGGKALVDVVRRAYYVDA